MLKLLVNARRYRRFIRKLVSFPDPQPNYESRRKKKDEQPLSGFSVVKASYFKILVHAFINLRLAAWYTVPMGFQWGFCF